MIKTLPVEKHWSLTDERKHLTDETFLPEIEDKKSGRGMQFDVNSMSRYKYCLKLCFEFALSTQRSRNWADLERKKILEREEKGIQESFSNDRNEVCEKLWKVFTIRTCWDRNRALCIEFINYYSLLQIIFT